MMLFRFSLYVSAAALFLLGLAMHRLDLSPPWLAAAGTPPPRANLAPLAWALYTIAILIGLYTLRHYCFTLNRLFGRQRHPYLDIDTDQWPTLTVLIAAHNEEAVIADALHALLAADYPRERLCLMPVNDRSVDGTRAIIDTIAAAHPGRICPFHRIAGRPGKAAALKDACARLDSDIVIVFDADYLPSPGLVKQLVAPFFDPEIGAVMGRVVPLNVRSTLLTRLLDLERSGGYQVDQQARMNLGFVPQYGGTVGGVRMAALRAIGGWHDSVLAEDTDLTFRLLLAGWKTVYQNHSECYEEVPERWPVRIRQISRWSKGHNQALFRHGAKLLLTPHARWAERLDGLLLLGVYLMAPLLLTGWLLAALLFYFDAAPALGLFIGLFALTCQGTLGNFAAFFEIAAAVHLDGSSRRIRLLPLNLLGFLVSAVAISGATLGQACSGWLLRGEMRWDKTVRYRKPA